MKKLLVLTILITVLLSAICFADTILPLPSMQEILKVHNCEDRSIHAIDSAFFYSAAMLYLPRIFSKDDTNSYEGIFGTALCLGAGFLTQRSGKGFFEQGYENYETQINPEMTDKEKEDIAYKEVKKIAENHRSQRIAGALAIAGLGTLSAVTDLKNNDKVYEENFRLTGYGFMLWGLYEAIWGTTLFEDIVAKYEANKSISYLKVSLMPGVDSIGINGSYRF